MSSDVERKTRRWVQKTLSRARSRGSWDRVFGRDECWTPAVFAALVDENDRLMLGGEKELAAEIGTQLPILAARIPASRCPKGDLGQRSLEVLGLAVAAGSWRTSGRLDRSREAFSHAFEKANRGIFRWAMAELQKRLGFHQMHLPGKSHQALDSLAKAIEVSQQTAQKGEAINLLGICQGHLLQDETGAIRAFSRALALIDPTQGERAAWVYQAACHNIAFQLVKGGGCTLETLEDSRRLLRASRNWLGKGMDVRKARTVWTEGLLVYRIGFNRHGERLLERARKSLLKLGLVAESALVTLDLMAMLIQDGDNRRTPELATEVRDSLDRLAPELAKSLPDNIDLDRVGLARQTLYVEAYQSHPRQRIGGRSISTQ